ncbi:hypothetical protein Dimus_013013 [Dionaea muscipula]
MSVLQPSQQPLAHEGQETIKKNSSAKKLFMEKVIQECQRQDNGKQMVEKEKEQEDQTSNAMQTAHIDDQVLGSSVIHNDAGELRTDGHERDGGMKRKRMSEADIDDDVLGSSAMHNDAGELRTDEHERVLGYFISDVRPLSIDRGQVDDMNKVYKDAKGENKRWVVPNGAKKWVLQTIGVLWRNFKGRLKRDHYTPYETTKMRWKNRPEDVSDEDFKFLLKKWKDPKYKALMEIYSMYRVQFSMKNVYILFEALHLVALHAHQMIVIAHSRTSEVHK